MLYHARLYYHPGAITVQYHSITILSYYQYILIRSSLSTILTIPSHPIPWLLTTVQSWMGCDGIRPSTRWVVRGGFGVCATAAEDLP